MINMDKKINFYVFTLSINVIETILKIISFILIALFILHCTLIMKSVGHHYSALGKLLVLSDFIKQHPLFYFPYIMLAIFIGGFRYYLKLLRYDENVNVDQTSGNFGTACYAGKKDLEKLNAY